MSNHDGSLNIQGGDVIDGILIIPEFLPVAECDKLSRAGWVLLDGGMMKPFGNGSWNCQATKLFSAASYAGDPYVTFLRLVAKRIDPQVLRLDHSIYACLEYGGSHELHADNSTLDGRPNHTPSRRVSVGIYFGDYGVDYAGGCLVFPNIGQVVEPKKGMLVAFPSGLLHQHEVEVVKCGSRDNLFYWFS